MVDLNHVTGRTCLPIGFSTLFKLLIRVLQARHIVKFLICVIPETPHQRIRWQARSTALIFSIAIAALNLNLVHAKMPARITQQAFVAWQGKVIYVVDGDTLQVRSTKSGKRISIRIDGIDAPEICQVGGQEARDALSQRVLGQQVVVQPKATDKYGRTIGDVFKGNVNQGSQMVMTGQAWAFYYKTDRGRYAILQRKAQAMKMGIFSLGAYPQTPVLFRKMHGSCY